MEKIGTFWRDTAVSVLGGVLYAIGMNLIALPFGLFMGTFAGVAQVLESLTLVFFPALGNVHINLLGVYLFLMNAPLLLLALRSMSRGFFIKTVLTVSVQSAVMALLPVPGAPLLDSRLAAAIVGGLLAGFGAGITLRAGGSGGGADILGVVLSKKYPGFSVGRLVQCISVGVFAYCLFTYDFNIVVHSIIFTMVYSWCLDRFHHQNIKTSALICTYKPEVLRLVLDGLHRGATCWQGTGGYTQKPLHIFMTVVSKYEVGRLKRELARADPEAFVVVSDHVGVIGNFQKHL